MFYGKEEGKNNKEEREKEKTMQSVNSWHQWVSIFVGLWAQGGGVGLWPTSDTRTQNPESDCLDPGRRRGIPDIVPDKQQERVGRGQRYSVAVTPEGDWIFAVPLVKAADYQVYRLSSPCTGGWRCGHR